jgi:hypothetical protein
VGLIWRDSDLKCKAEFLEAETGCLAKAKRETGCLKQSKIEARGVRKSRLHKAWIQETELALPK